MVRASIPFVLAALLVGGWVGYCVGTRSGPSKSGCEGHAHRYVPIATPPADAKPIDLTGVKLLSWETLARYTYKPGLEDLPEAIRALDGARVLIDGYLMTLFEYDDIREFHLVANHWSCCGGVPPGLNGAIRVTLSAEAPGLPNTIKPLRLVGTFRVEEQRDGESDIVWAIYRLEDVQALILSQDYRTPR